MIKVVETFGQFIFETSLTLPPCYGKRNVERKWVVKEIVNICRYGPE